jgi:hypothetical protein
MTRRLGLTSLAVLVIAFGGAASGPARPLQSLRLVVALAWPNATEQVEHETRLPAPRVPQPSSLSASRRAPRSIGIARLQVQRWLFQRPPPVAI